MTYKSTYLISFLTIVVLLLQGCIEELPLETIDFESALVIEATLTDELKQQEIKLTRTFKFEEENPSAERNATVLVVDDAGNSYNFQEGLNGSYLSTVPFGAQPNRKYSLQITTNDGRSYLSKEASLTSTTQMDNVYASREMNDEGGESMVIFVDTFDPTGNSRYYRYEYEETFKIVAPFYEGLEAIVVSTSPLVFGTEPRDGEQQTCFKTEISNTIVQTETNGFTEDRLTRFPIRFISSDNYIITHRYSILVRQYVQSLEAFTFYKTLNELSGSESLLSENQPGFFGGNVFSMESASEKVLGFFEVTSVSSKRIYFNYRDFFPTEPVPPYVEECEIFSPPIMKPGGTGSPLFDAIFLRSLVFYDFNENPTVEEGPFYMVVPECGDCTSLGSNIKPDFWVD